MYNEKSVMTAAKIMSKIDGMIPAFANASGSDKTPPPTFYFVKKNEKKCDDEKDGETE